MPLHTSVAPGCTAALWSSQSPSRTEKPSPSVSGSIVVPAVAELFVWSKSDSLPLTLAVLLRLPAVVGVTTSVIVAEAPLAKVPRLQVIVLVPLQLPWVDVTETRMTSDGNVSSIFTPVAVEGPLLVTVMR